MIYLASTYSHPSADVREDRYRRVCEYAAILISQGEDVLSPIAHSHGIARFLGPDAVPFRYWRAFDLKLMRQCSRVVVLKLDGWDESEGIKAEVEEARNLGLPVEYVST